MKLKVKAIKNQVIIQKIGRIVLFGLIVSLLCYQLKSFNWSEAKSVHLKASIFLFLAIILVFPNWLLEWKKWKIGMENIFQFPQEVLLKGFYAGMLSGFVTPSALGNFLGRMTVVNKEWKPKVVANTVMGNGAQFLVSLLFGFISLLLVGILHIGNNSNLVLILLFLFILVVLFLYFFIGINRFSHKKIKKLVPSLSGISVGLRMHFLLFSALRYLVFSTQFFLIIKAFEPEISINVLFWIWQLYLWTTLSPSIFLGKLFIRETMAIFILSFAGIELPIALVASILVWSMNNAIPSVFAYFKWKKYVLVKV